MKDRKDQYDDLTEKASLRDNTESTSRARPAESDNLYSGGSGLNNTSSPEGDSDGENKVATSVSDE